MVKRILSLLLAAIMLLSTVGTMGSVAYSASRMYAKDKLDDIMTISGYIPGKTAIVTGNCYAFVSKVCEKMYGKKYDGEGLYGNYKSHHYSGNYKTVATFTTSDKTPNATNIDKIRKFFVNNALPGDVIHFGTLTSGDSNTSTHTVMVYSVSNTRLRIYHANYQTIDYASTDCHIDSLYWDDWKKNPTTNTYTDSGHMYSSNRLFYNKMNVNGLGISINRYVKYDDLYLPTNITKPTVTLNRTSTTSIKTKWDKIMYATKYRVQYRPDGSTKYKTATSKAKGTSYNVTGLQTGTKYFFRVCAYVNGEWRDYSDEVCKKVLPPQLTKLTDKEKASGLRLSWTPYADLTGIEVHRATKKDGKYTKLKTITKQAADGYTDTTVKYGKTYYYKIKRYVVVDGTTYSTTSAPIAASYKLAKPKITISRTSTTSMLYKFKGDGAQTAYVYTLTNSKGKKIKEGSTSKKELEVRGLRLGETYTMTCAEQNKFGTGPEGSASKQQLPASSSDITVSLTSSGILVKYATAEDVDGYYIYRSTEPDGEYQRVGTVSSYGIDNYLDTDIELNTTYYYKTRRYVTKDGKTYLSALSSKCSDGAELHLDHPGGFSVARRTPTSVALKWSEVDNATSYIVYYKLSGSSTWRATQPTTSTKINIGSLTTGKNYVFQVYARNRIGASEPTAQKKVRVMPAKVKNVAVEKKNNGLRLSWSKQSGVSGYMVYRATSKNGKYKKISTITSASTAQYGDTNVTSGKTYYYKVCSYKNVGKERYCGSLSGAVSQKY